MNHALRVYEDILQTLPNAENPTPIVRINRLNPSAAYTLYAKLEWMNPFGSVKDRAAAYLIRELERQGNSPRTGASSSRPPATPG